MRAKINFLAFSVLISLAWSSANAGERILLSAFSAFDGAQDNPSRVVVDRFVKIYAAAWKKKGVVIDTVTLPVVYGKAETLLNDKIAEFKPTTVISFGVGGTYEFNIELVAENLDSSDSPDEEGVSRKGEVIIPGGPKLLNSRLQTQRILASLKQAHISASLSKDAGGYLCNHIFYHLMATANQNSEIRHAGFIHVPMVGWNENYPEYAKHYVAAIQSIITSTLEK